MKVNTLSLTMAVIIAVLGFFVLFVAVFGWKDYTYTATADRPKTNGWQIAAYVFGVSAIVGSGIFISLQLTTNAPPESSILFQPLP